MSTFTVVRIPNPENIDPVQRVISTVARVDLALAEALHDPDQVRPYSCVRRRETIDVVCCTDALAQTILRGEPQGRLVTRVRLAEIAQPPLGPILRLAFMTPTAFHVSGREHALPEPLRVFGHVYERWTMHGWPELPVPQVKRIAAWPEAMSIRGMPGPNGIMRYGFVGVVRYDIGDLSQEHQAAIWALARFAEYRGVGRNTTYGLGRVRILRPHERWEPGTIISVWEVEHPRASRPSSTTTG